MTAGNRSESGRSCSEALADRREQEADVLGDLDVDAGLERARALASLVSRKSPTAIAAFKGAMLESLGQPESVRLDAERRAYELTVKVGDAATGRSHFADIRQGKVPPWAPRATGPLKTGGEG